MFIKRITIKNFRSIVNESLEPNRLNVIVGNNDAGKSNFLKALNLFFNNQTEPGISFNFDKDFSLFASVAKKKAKEISIEITFEPPQSYKEERAIVWKKVWRQDSQSPFSDNQYHIDESPLDGRSKVQAWLRSIKFRYVPAIKSNTYFARLLRDLHDVLASTVQEDLRNAAKAFVQSINIHTQNITTDLYKTIGIDSSIQLPLDLSELFEILDFQTNSGKNFVSLNNRGDGIKVRHIPIILKFLAEQENINRKQGSARINTIWGYEEPENNLELSKGFEQAREFIEYSTTIQIFLSTHSPAFYSIGKLENLQVNVYFVRAEEGYSKINLIQPSERANLAMLDNQMGLLPFITPHIEREVKEYKQKEEELKQRIDELQEDNNTLFLEGKTDVVILKKAIEIFAPELEQTLRIKSDESAGANWVKDFLIAWVASRKQTLAAGLFDNDDAGKKAKSDADEFLRNKQNLKAKSFKLHTPSHLHGIFSKGIKLPVSLEEVFPPNIWQFAEEQDWLESRTNIIELNHFSNNYKTFKDYCVEKGLDIDELRYVLYTLKDSKKGELVKQIARFDENQLRDALAGFQSLVSELSSYFKT